MLIMDYQWVWSHQSSGVKLKTTKFSSKGWEATLQNFAPAKISRHTVGLHSLIQTQILLLLCYNSVSSSLLFSLSLSLSLLPSISPAVMFSPSCPECCSTELAVSGCVVWDPSYSMFILLINTVPAMEA